MKKIQLFCMPFAGGTETAFDVLLPYLDESIELVPLNYAGRGDRKTEKLNTSFEELVEDVQAQLKARRNPELPYAILGYSMGSVAAYETVIQEKAGDGLLYLFLAAHVAPDEHWAGMDHVTKNDEDFLEYLQSLGGFQQIENKMLKNRFFRKMYFDPIRNDYDILVRYMPKEKKKLPVEATVFYAPADMKEQEIKTWNRFSDHPIEYIPLGDTHFFIKQHAQEMAEIINKRLTERG